MLSTPSWEATALFLERLAAGKRQRSSGTSGDDLTEHEEAEPEQDQDA